MSKGLIPQPWRKYIGGKNAGENFEPPPSLPPLQALHRTKYQGEKTRIGSFGFLLQLFSKLNLNLKLQSFKRHNEDRCKGQGFSQHSMQISFPTSNMHIYVSQSNFIKQTMTSLGVGRSKMRFWQRKNDEFLLRSVAFFFVTAQSLGPFRAPQGVG